MLFKAADARMGRWFAGLAVVVMILSLFMVAWGQSGSTSSSSVSAPILANLQGQAKTRVADLIQQARSEGSLAWIDSVPVPKTAQAMFSEFQKEYGLPNVKLNFERISTANIGARLEQEVQAGHITTDMAAAAFPALWRKLKAANALEHYVSPQAVNYAASAKYVDDNPGYWISPDAFAIIPMANTKLYSKPINSWTDLTDAALSGQKILIPNAQASASGLYTYIGLKKVLPSSFFSKLAAQKPEMSVGSSVKDTEAAINGNVDVTITVDFRPYQLASQTGVSLKTYYPKEGVVMLGQSYALMAHSPDPAVAKLFLDFLLSKTGQQIYANHEGITPTRDGVQLSATVRKYAPASINAVKVIPMNWNMSSAAIDQARQAWSQTFKR